MAKTASRAETKDLFLDAAERLLVRVGYAGISTRSLAEEAGANHGLVHYYFGSMEELLVQVLERFTTRLIERQRKLYSKPAPFIDKWRAAMRYLDEDLSAGYQKIWLELQALAWNKPELRDRVAGVNAEWRGALRQAFASAADEYGIDTEASDIEAMVSLVMTFNQGIILERHSGVFEGQDALLQRIERWLESREGRRDE